MGQVLEQCGGGGRVCVCLGSFSLHASPGFGGFAAGFAAGAAAAAAGRGEAVPQGPVVGEAERCGRSLQGDNKTRHFFVHATGDYCFLYCYCYY